MLPHQRQPLAKFIKFHDLTSNKVAQALGCNPTRVRNLINGNVYPSPNEIVALEFLFKLPIDVLLEPAMLIYRNGPWPPLRGGAEQFRHEQRLREQGVKVDPDPNFYDSQLTGAYDFSAAEAGA